MCDVKLFQGRIIAIFSIALSPCFSWAGGLQSLQQFMTTVKSAQAEFTQVVTAPPKDGQAARAKTSSGSFEFARPNRFKFVYRQPFAQTMVGDGQNLWLFDADLNQVTVRKQADVLAGTPALLTAAPDLAALQVHFNLQDAPDREGLQWVQATPKAGDGALQSVRLGFAGADLKVLEMVDNFGQRSVLTFKAMQINPVLPPQTFVFTPPKGADVLR